MASATAFSIRVSDADIKDLQARLRNTRLHEPLEGVGWEYGMQSQAMKDFAEYWANDFDWKKQVSGALFCRLSFRMPTHTCSLLC